MGKFSIHANPAAKTLESKVEGVMSVQDAVNFIAQYKHAAAAIPTTQYSLIFDCTKLGVSPKESQEKLMECFALYKQANFKETLFLVGNNSILKMQLSRMAQSAHLERYQIK